MNSTYTISQLRKAYLNKQFSAKQFLQQQLAAVNNDTNNCWISLISEQQLNHYLDTLEQQNIADLPLYGVPFAIKDNIDLAGLTTTAGCKEYAFQPSESAFVVQQLIAAGAVPLGKTNLDQFATGLVGTRSPWGAVKNSFDESYISGGSSSGSAVSVAKGQVCFSLGTDTAGSGRVPAALNNILGLKATKGLLSCSGVVPACKSLDCVTLFAHTTDDLNLLLDVAGEYDAKDCYARPNQADNTINHYQPLSELTGLKIAVPKAENLAFFGNAATEQLFGESLEQLRRLGAELVEIDFEPFLAAAKLLYEGPWVAERYAAIEAFFEKDPSQCLPVIQTIIGGAKQHDAVGAFKAFYQLQAYKVICDQVVKQFDAIVTPTAGSSYTIEALNQDPIQLNSNMGYYTNFMNLLDYSAISVPAGFYQNPQGKQQSFGITLFSSAYADRRLLSMSALIQQDNGFALGASKQPLPTLDAVAPCEDQMMELAVCGAHLSGLPLNGQLTERAGQLIKATHSAAVYKLYALAGGPPARPGMIRDEQNGVAIEVEVWRLPKQHLGSFLQGIPHPLGLGKIELADGTWVNSFICEGYAAATAKDVSEFGGWRAYLASL
ncbi:MULTISPECIES: allophanate hydrolase [unclassified Agarivorans]|uniref:allophanate hydrolase n=1 Tax=unclassified Agarivorans TaxID=2636026 RepID=UPI0026E183CF|nr:MULTISPECIES: allophanate hydrolase [unclassified Agarivorans]MDO6685004.1 allophanate hydrolase [Agarivorans sp. 3_MG-2023]MDO6717438.1 allophanate hydrolase [Agarivorans sp. 2_MG-2023]